MTKDIEQPALDNIIEATQIAEKLFDSISAKFGRAEAEKIWNTAAKGKPGRPPKTELSDLDTRLLFQWDQIPDNQPETVRGFLAQLSPTNEPQFFKDRNITPAALERRMRRLLELKASGKLICEESLLNGVPTYTYRLVGK